MEDQEKNQEQLVEELSRTRAELKECRWKWQMLLDNAPQKIFMKDTESRWVFCNEKLAQDLGLSPEQVAGKTDYEFFPKELAEKYRADDQRIMKSGQPEVLEESYIQAGQEVIVQTFKKPIKDDSGRDLGILGIFSDITAYKRTEQEAVRQNKVLKAINRVFTEAIACETWEALGQACLEIAMDLTDSKYGYIGEINPKGRHDTIALSNPGWRNCKVPETQAPLLIRDMEIRGIWGRVLKDGVSLLTNDPGSHPDSVGIPDGHPDLTAFLGVPLKEARKTFGMIALANKEGGFEDSDREAAESLAGAIVQALRNKRAEMTAKAERQRLFRLMDGLPAYVYLQAPDYTIPFANRYFRETFGENEGVPCYKLLFGRNEPCQPCVTLKVLESQEPHTREENLPNGRTYEVHSYPFSDVDGSPLVLEMGFDITDRKRAEQVIARQAREILELSTPVVQVWEGVVAAPLIGTLDSDRTQQFMERFLSSIVETKSPVAMVDITGVPTVDTQTAQHLIEAITAARLLGTQVILTGVSPGIAQTLVHLGIDLGGIETRSSLVGGLKVALKILGLQVTKQ